MPLNSWKNTQTGAQMTTDPRTVLLSYLQTNWAAITPAISPGVNDITFGTELGANPKNNAVIVELMPDVPEKITLGGGLEKHEAYFRIQLFAQWNTAETDLWKMKENLDDLIGANPLALRGDGIDEMILGELPPVDIPSDGVASAGLAKFSQLKRQSMIVKLLYYKTIG